MPTYQYRCAKGHAFEVFQKISERAKSRCPECGARATRLISGGAGLIFKGSGFYITDYGKDGKGPRKEKESSEPTSAEKPAAEKSGADKPATSDGTKAEKPAKKPPKKTGKDSE
jgi:putative FmdB family regulatory protein